MIRRQIPVLIALFLAGLSGCVPFARLESVLVSDEPLPKGVDADLEVEREGTPIEVAVGMPLDSGDDLLTGDDTYAVLKFKGGARAILFPATSVNIHNDWPTIEFRWGAVEVLLARVRKALTVQDENSSATPHRTEFLVERGEADEFVVTVLRGLVVLESRHDHWNPVWLAQFERGSAPAEAEDIPLKEPLDEEEIRDLSDQRNRIERARFGRRATLLVPPVIGLAQADAEALIEAQGLEVGEVRRVIDEGVAIGAIAGQDPVAGERIRAGREVDLELAVRAVRVPDLIGIHADKAADRLEALGLRAEFARKDTITGRVPAHTINRQDPAGGKELPEGSPVELWIEAVSVAVPAVEGLPLERARALIEGAGLSVGRVDKVLVADRTEGEVLGQSPSAGELVRPGQRVDLSVADPGVEVPNVTKGTLRQAVSLLSAAGLTVGAQTIEVILRVETGTVLRQSPGAGQRVATGSRVNLVLAQEGTVVPDVTGQSQKAALDMMRRVGLVPSVVDVSSNQYPDCGEASVCKQSLAPTTTQAIGSDVVLYYLPLQ